MRNKLIATESFSSNGRHYFLDFMLATNGTNYISITRSDELAAGQFARKTINVFQEDFEFLISCFASLFRSAAYASEHVHVKDLKKQQAGGNSIKNWPMGERPREKMIEHGAKVMADEELLAMLIGSGTPDESAVALARRMLESVHYDLAKLGGMNHADFCQFSGMGIAKSSSIIAAFELGRRAYSFFQSGVSANITAGIRSMDTFLYVSGN